MPSGTFSDCWLLCHVYVLFFQFLVLLGASGAQSCLLTLALSHTMRTIGYYAIRMFNHSHMIICHQALANKEPLISCVL